MDTNVDIDGRIDWEQFYSPYIKQAKISGGNIIGLCPFHQDSKPSFSVSLNNGLYKCFACGEEGNPTTFLEKFEGISSKEAYKKLLEIAGYDTTQEAIKKQSDKIMPYTIDDYANDKGFSVEFLQGLKIKNTKAGISIPYMDETGQFVRNRIRYGHNHPMRFSWGKGGPICLYGLWKIEKIKATKTVVLVEGESDTQTLWTLGFSAMGVPGASTFKKEWVQYFNEVDSIYLHQEPDQGGETFISKIVEKLKECEYKGKVYVFSLPSYKDPSDMFTKLRDNDKCKDIIKGQLSSASLIDLNMSTERTIECSPVKLKPLENYAIDDTGVYMFVKDSWMHICRTPIVLSKRIRNIETDEEKVEIAYKRDGRWHYLIEKRSVVFQSRNIVGLADVGITVTSENAKFLVRYLQELEAVNFDILDKNECVTQLGWHEDRFLPYGDEHLIVDVESNAKMWVNGYKAKSELDTWIKFAEKHRACSPIIRAYIAAACATPFLKPLGQRIFYLYNWSDTEGGKTACLNLALSVWGDPTKLMQTYNSTSVGLEYMASYMNDLPLGLNERQSAGKDQAKLETDAYRLAEGKGRLRGNKKGGLQTRGEWRSIILANGEEPFITPSTMSGVSTRTIELYGKPFVVDADAKSVYEFIGETYGVMGKDIVQRFLAKEKVHEVIKVLKQLNKIIDEELRKLYANKKSSNISAVAFISAIDVFLSANYFNRGIDQKILLEDTLNMAQYILEQVESKKDTDIIEKFYNDTQDWLNINRNKFLSSNNVPSNEIYGMIENNGLKGVTYYVFPKIFEDFCKREEQSYKKILQGFAERNYVSSSKEGEKVLNTIRKSIAGKQCRVIQFYFDEEVEDEKEEMPF